MQLLAPWTGQGVQSTGTATLNFGAFPGSSDASVAVTGIAGIAANAIVSAWVLPAATADHSADEHVMESLQVQAGNVVAGTGFTIYGSNFSTPDQGGKGRIYGAWNIAWTWQNP